MYYFIVNPNSGSGRGLETWNRLKETLHKKNICYQIFLTEHSGHATRLAEEISSSSFEDQSERTVVALGGDGTLNEVVNGLRFSRNITLGFIPCGSGNDFARAMKISKNPEKALQRILDPQKVLQLDYGISTMVMNGIPVSRRFAVSTGCGFDAEVCEQVMKSKLKKLLNCIHLGKLSYLVIGLREILCCKEYDGLLTIDSNQKIPLKNIRFISFHNVKYEGGGFLFSPKALPDDGLVSICVVSGCSALKFIRILLFSIVGKHSHLRGVRVFHCRRADLSLKRPRVIHTDGEIPGETSDISVQCEYRKIRFVC